MQCEACEVRKGRKRRNRWVLCDDCYKAQRAAVPKCRPRLALKIGAVCK
jgi:hypothetical protein